MSRKTVPGAKTVAQMKAMLTPAERAAVKKQVAILAQEELSLADLRKAQHFTQEALAQKLGVRQATVSQVESSADLYLSTLRKHVEAMGGELTLMARFPNRTPVVIAGIKRKAAKVA